MDVKALLAKMTLEEKLAEMSQFNANCLDSDSEGGVTGPAQSMELTPEDIPNIGSTLNFTGAAEMKKIQAAHLAENRHGIPLLFMQDVIHGFRTIYPIPLGMGASFDTELMKRCCAMAAKEAALGGVQVTFGPMVDLVRDARWGRCMESTGEDPYLNSKMAAAQVEGFQGDYSSKYNIAACVKHFAAYGAAESGRDYNTVDMSRHSLRQFYLPAYRAAIDAGVDMLMTSFNTLNGIPAAGNKWLVKDLLRDEWGFDKVIISDYDAFFEMVTHGYCRDAAESAERAFATTTDIEMMSNCYIKSGRRLIEEGKLTMEQIDESVLRILKLKEKLGVFENPYSAADEEEAKRVYLSREHRDICREAAEKSAVLLRNEGVLPFSSEIRSVAVVGPYANTGMIGFWACHGRDEEAVSAVEGLAAYLGEENVRYAMGADGALLARPNNALIAEAVAAAAATDAAIVCVGEDKNMSGEGNSRADISLSDAEKALIRAVVKVNPKTVVVLYSGRPLALLDIVEDCPAIVEMWQPGSEGGSALANLLFGKVDFTARLPMTFPRMVGQVPIFYNRNKTGRPKPDDRKTTIYRSQYLDCMNAPLYPFGYGLSYTTFEITEPTLDKNKMKSGDTIVAMATVKNTGNRASETLVQLYIRDDYASIVRPVKELRGYQKLKLAPGEEKQVSFTISEDDLKFYNDEERLVSEPGDFSVFIGLSSDEERLVRFELL